MNGYQILQYHILMPLYGEFKITITIVWWYVKKLVVLGLVDTEYSNKI